MWTGLSVLFAAQAMAQTTPNLGPIECGLPFATRRVERFADLPEPIRTDILKNGKVAETGEDFNESDAILDRSLPYRRFVRAGTDRRHWFIWLDHGGFDRHLDVIGYTEMQDTPTSVRWYRSAELTGEPCVATSAILGGVQTDAHK